MGTAVPSRSDPVTRTPTLPPPLDVACQGGHPLELWVLVNGEIVQCLGNFLSTGDDGRPRVNSSLPETFYGKVRDGSAVRGFFTDAGGQVHTFLTSVRRWQAHDDRPRSAHVVLETPTAVAPCQRRRGLRQTATPLEVELSVTIRGERTAVTGRLVDVSPTGLGVRAVRSPSHWFAEGTAVTVRLTLEGQGEVELSAIIARVESHALHWFYGLRMANARQRQALDAMVQKLLAPA